MAITRDFIPKDCFKVIRPISQMINLVARQCTNLSIMNSWSSRKKTESDVKTL